MTGGDGRPFRAIDIACDEGLALRVLPDRGLDIGAAWYGGRPLHWTGWAEEAPPAPCLVGDDWERHFFGGLLSTCGLSNVGEPSEGEPLHGRYNHRTAGAVSVTRSDDAVVVAGTVSDAVDGVRLNLHRRIEVAIGCGRVTITDDTLNEGRAAVPSPILYHVNFGWPIVADDCEVAIPERVATEVEFGDPGDLPQGWERPGLATGARAAVTLEHTLDPAAPHGRAALRSPSAALEASVSFDRSTLPRLLQWIDCRPENGVVAFEPANSGTRGRGHERQRGTLPVLGPGERRTTAVTIEARRI